MSATTYLNIDRLLAQAQAEHSARMRRLVERLGKKRKVRSGRAVVCDACLRGVHIHCTKCGCVCAGEFRWKAA
jgi:hypothetical protein